MQTFLINLDKDKERLISVDAQLKRLCIAYERFPAVYAKEMPKEERDSKVNYFRFRCCIGRHIWLGEIGCCLSHYSLYQRMIDENIPYACILEDDIVLTENFKSTVKRVELFLEHSLPQVFLLSNYTNEVVDGEEIREVNNGYCTDAYIITKSAAKALLKENLPICVPCDHWARWVRHKAIKLYVVLPSVCTQNNTDFVTSIPSNGEKKVSDMSLLDKIGFKARRVLGVSFDYILYKLHK